MSQTKESSNLAGAATGRPRTPGRRSGAARGKPGGKDLLQALPWIAPALLLIIGVVLFPAGVMFFNSTRDISLSGLDKGSVGFDNFVTVFTFAEFWPIMFRTIIWVVAVVTFTVMISLGLAQILNKAFPGRQIVRMAVIVPWAASVVMTTMVFYYSLEPYFGVFNKFLYDIGLADDAVGYGWTKNPATAFAWSIVIAIFVSLPFTTYTILAGLQTVPADTLEAAKMDGAGATRTYWTVVVPQLRSALAVAILINIINVFNSLPILKVMTGSIPGYGADTIMTMIFKYIELQKKVDVASALSVVAFLIVIVIVAIYVKAVKPMKEV
ncbi:sugar ABC transporter permease [Microbacterium sp. 1.5R]|nr:MULTISPECIES: sugar ABC transporter permease [unclassified Microbacterium]AKV87104.1 sugar ABC transporter permease [Microbacterium sp. CGR1]APH43621.1 sugar ABC transporter permease [Microbacterium sp. 1.5R]MBC6493646.1 sugar ABC transporter permease [Microbacterium sp. 4-7]MDY0983902.1 sugar ABC transporter permease [Microbacterium sp. CFBP9023]CAH0239571.1 Trehalose transport system permease protein SugA [Microbacterium sp. Bi98]